MQLNLFMTRASIALALCSSGWCLASESISNEIRQGTQNLTESSITTLDIPASSITPVSMSIAIKGFGMPLKSGQLDGYRGGFEQVNNDMQLSGTVANNSATNVVTGSNYIGSGSFSNSSGLPMVVQNSGSNVLIQTATIINVQYQ